MGKYLYRFKVVEYNKIKGKTYYPGLLSREKEFEVELYEEDMVRARDKVFKDFVFGDVEVEIEFLGAVESEGWDS